MFKKALTIFSVLVGLGMILPGFAQEKTLSKRYVPALQTDVSFFGLGALEIGRDWGAGTKEIRQHPNDIIAQNTLKTAVNAGVNLIDTANAYHLSQERIGEYLSSSHNRSKIILETKVGNYSILANDKRCKLPSYDGFYCNSPAAGYDFSAEGITRDVETSLAQMKTPYLDVVYLHMGDDPEKVLKDKVALVTLQNFKKEGVIHHIGISVDNPKVAIEAINSGDFDAIELEYNLLNQSNADAIALAHKKGMLVVVRGGLATGLLTPKVAPFLNEPDLPYGKQIRALLNLTHHNYQELMGLELAFLYSNPNISAVIIGAANPHEFTEDVNLLNNFNNPQLLQQAEALMSQYKPEGFTDSVDVYFAKKAQGGLPPAK